MPAGSSHEGDRFHQEDAWLVAQRGGATLCVVCDGMGAGASGHPAAALTVAMVRTAFDAGAPVAVIMGSVVEANRAIHGRSTAARRQDVGSDPRWLGMGTTAEVALFVDGRAHLGHVGDGFIYRVREGRLQARTTAHTLVNQYRRLCPELSDAELERLPQNIIMRALGSQANVEVDRADEDALPGDVWLLCSDGLTAVLSEEAIESILVRGGNASEMVRALMDAALGTQGDAKDNITVVVHVV
jgi:serine/threonine protein phosphatase PrpC